MIEKLKNTTHLPVTRKYTAKEIADMKTEVLDRLGILESLEADMKASRDSYKSRISTEDARVRELRGSVARGTYEERAECAIYLDFEAGLRRYINTSTGEEHKTEALTESDRQRELELIEEANQAKEEEAEKKPARSSRKTKGGDNS